MDIKKIIHKLATDQTVTDHEFMVLLAEVIKAKTKQKEKQKTIIHVLEKYYKKN